jgi:hypothetical protein
VEVRLDDNKIRIFDARRTNVTGLNAREPRAEQLALPKSVECGNLGLNKAVIRWMSEQLCFGADVPKNSPASLTRVDICRARRRAASEVSTAASNLPFAAQTKAQDRRCAKMQSTAFGRRL